MVRLLDRDGAAHQSSGEDRTARVIRVRILRERGASEGPQVYPGKLRCFLAGALHDRGAAAVVESDIEHLAIGRIHTATREPREVEDVAGGI